MPLFTIGHSLHSMQVLLALLEQHAIEVVGDVRSLPGSRHAPQFNAAPLRQALQDKGLRYLFLGRELGARRQESPLPDAAGLPFAQLSKEADFRATLDLVCQWGKEQSLALLCAEKDPASCHRGLLIGRLLQEQKVPVQHILADGGLLCQEELEDTLLQQFYLPSGDLFRNREDCVAEAYALQEQRLKKRRAMRTISGSLQG
jgi:uncharacterized protein (DUF488 family)